MSEDSEGEWLTYRQLGAQLGCTANAARMHAHRRNWPKRASNRIGEQAKVLVPPGGAVRESAVHVAAQSDACANGIDSPYVQAFEQAIAALTAALAAERARTDSLQAELTAANRRLIEVLTVHRPWWRRWLR